MIILKGEHLKSINFPFRTNGKLIVLGVPILKHFRVLQGLQLFQFNFCILKNVGSAFKRNSSPCNLLTEVHVFSVIVVSFYLGSICIGNQMFHKEG